MRLLERVNVKNIFTVLIITILATIPVILALRDQGTQTTDAACITDCTQRGYGLDYCQKRCSLDPDAQARNTQLADPQCMGNCERAGRNETYCTKTCRY